MKFKECRKFAREELIRTHYPTGYMFYNNNIGWYFNINRINTSEVRYMIHKNGTVNKL